MNIKNEICQEFFTGERALFGSKYLRVKDTIFDDGESPLKESHDIELVNSMFKWKYPLWYCEDITVKTAPGLRWAAPVSGIRNASVWRTAP